MYNIIYYYGYAIMVNLVETPKYSQLHFTGELIYDIQGMRMEL